MVDTLPLGKRVSTIPIAPCRGLPCPSLGCLIYPPRLRSYLWPPPPSASPSLPTVLFRPSRQAAPPSIYSNSSQHTHLYTIPLNMQSTSFPLLFLSRPANNLYHHRHPTIDGSGGHSCHTPIILSIHASLLSAPLPSASPVPRRSTISNRGHSSALLSSTPTRYSTTPLSRSKPLLDGSSRSQRLGNALSCRAWTRA